MEEIVHIFEAFSPENLLGGFPPVVAEVSAIMTTWALVVAPLGLGFSWYRAQDAQGYIRATVIWFLLVSFLASSGQVVQLADDIVTGLEEVIAGIAGASTDDIAAMMFRSIYQMLPLEANWGDVMQSSGDGLVNDDQGWGENAVAVVGAYLQGFFGLLIYLLSWGLVSLIILLALFAYYLFTLIQLLGIGFMQMFLPIAIVLLGFGATRNIGMLVIALYLFFLLWNTYLALFSLIMMGSMGVVDQISSDSQSSGENAPHYVSELSHFIVHGEFTLPRYTLERSGSVTGSQNFANDLASGILQWHGISVLVLILSTLFISSIVLILGIAASPKLTLIAANALAAGAGGAIRSAASSVNPRKMHSPNG